MDLKVEIYVLTYLRFTYKPVYGPVLCHHITDTHCRKMNGSILLTGKIHTAVLWTCKTPRDTKDLPSLRKVSG